MKTFACFMSFCVAVAVSTPAFAADQTEDVLEDLKCFIMPKRDVKGKKVMEYKGAKLYLCCSSCVKRMTKTPEKYEAKANHQLVQTGQFVQSSCPISGESVTESSAVLEIGGVKVKFATVEHQEKISKLEASKQIEEVFGAKGFKTGEFKLKEPEPEPTEGLN